ncbi:hypothetical protein [Hymenobacter rigui]|uniref:Lipocalin-like domain-containing protein n=1 Tax=Hymenobacter rigui TaxID=334424 RepID=A0A428KXI5_9BACT|nr:hypothetical protein [Hymenobacter rigui]RSK51398.1 hypothetical protein EI291_03570 [Hymenobacter rigui]
MTIYILLVLGSLLCMSSCTKPHSVAEAAVLGAWRPVSTASLSGEPNESICFIKIKERIHLVTVHFSGVRTAQFSPSGDSITLTQGCTGYKLPIMFSSLEDTLIFAGTIRYVRMDSADFNDDRRAFLKAHNDATALMK